MLLPGSGPGLTVFTDWLCFSEDSPLLLHTVAGRVLVNKVPEALLSYLPSCLRSFPTAFLLRGNCFATFHLLVSASQFPGNLPPTLARKASSTSPRHSLGTCPQSKPGKQKHILHGIPVATPHRISEASNHQTLLKNQRRKQKAMRRTSTRKRQDLMAPPKITLTPNPNA